jgi:HK97 family phage major capsid protein
LTIPTLTNDVKTYWTSENAAKTTTTANFGQTTLTAFKQAAILYASDELIEDSFAFDVVRMIIDLFSDAIAREEELAFARGNGTTQPTGLETALTATTIAAVTAVNQDFDDIINLEYALKAQYRGNAVYLMNSNTEREVRKLKDSNGRYLWQEPVAATQPGTLHGKPAYNCEQLANGHIFFGDFKRGYWIGDRGEIAVKITQDSETAFTKDQTAIRVVKRTAGAVIHGNAIKALTGF